MFCSSCGKENVETSAFCSKCGKPFGTKTVAPEVQSKQIGGWLFLLGFVLLISPFMLLYGVYDTVSLITDGTIEYIKDIAPGIDQMIWFEVIVDSILICITTYLIYLFTTKRHTFPMYYIWYLVTSTIYLVADYLLVASIVTVNDEMQTIIDEILAEQIVSMSGAIIGTVIWVLYLKKSNRVAETFVK
jgi:hypothetical protein